MDKKKFLRTVKLYLKATINPISLLWGLFMAVGMILLFAVEPVPFGSDLYASMISVIGEMHFGVIFILIGGCRIFQSKFYASSCCAKQLFTIVPTVVSMVMCLSYDIAAAVIAKVNLGDAGLSDTLIFNSVNAILALVTFAFVGKKKIEWLSVVPATASLALSGWLSHNYEFRNGLGLPVAAAVAIAVCVYALGFAVTLALTNFWWKNGDRFTMPNKFILNAIGKQ